MRTPVRQAISAYRAHGLSHVLKRGYRLYVKTRVSDGYTAYIRPRLSASREYPKYNGVTVGAEKHKHHRFDGVVPLDVPSSADRPQYEEPLVDALRSCVRPGDDVVIVGGGYGVTTVVAAQEAREGGTVTTYEAIDTRTDVIRNTVSLNGVSDRCTVVHGIVGPAINPGGGLPGGGKTDSAERLDPGDLPECDVLELDCEGSELEILRNLAIRPHTIVVETHGHRGASEGDVRAELDELGYSVVQRAVEVERNGIYVLTATRTDRE